jgi:hypothetical protein
MRAYKQSIYQPQYKILAGLILSATLRKHVDLQKNKNKRIAATTTITITTTTTAAATTTTTKAKAVLQHATKALGGEEV